MTRILPSKLKAAWCFLSLDYIAEVRGELWFPIESTSFQNDLREQLTPWLTQTQYHHEGDALSYAIADWCRNAYGNQALEAFLIWVRNIYISDGPDRVAEMVWKIVPYRAPDIVSEFPASNWVFELLAKVKQTQEELEETFESKLNDESVLSSWDTRVLDVQYATQDGLDTKINLIATYNIFLDAWEKHCSALSFEQLREVYKVGQRVAEIRQMTDLPVFFPGSWRFELMRFPTLRR